MIGVSELVFSRLDRRLPRAVTEGAARVPFLKRPLSAAYDRYFALAQGHIRLFRGIYPDFASATRALPKSREIGFDNDSSAYRLIDEWLTISEYDYPIMFWLAKLLPGSKSLFDWGGNVGLKYFAYRKYLNYSDDLRWTVCEVPAVVAAGEDVAKREGARALDFTTNLEALPEADILLAAGALHFIEDPLGDLRRLPALPEHILLSKVPVHGNAPAVTLHNMGTAICQYHLFNRTEFVREIESMGYELVDEWSSTDCFCHVPFHPTYSIRAYSGFYFRRRPC